MPEREAERTYEAPDGWPDLSALGPWTPTVRLDLHTQYHDTPTLALIRQGWSLRRRAGGPDQGWHLKSPAQGDIRYEWHEPWGESVPASLAARAASIIGGAPLGVVATLTTARTVTHLTDAHGGVRAHVCRDEVTALAGGHQTAWAELEVELAPDEPLATLDAIEAVLREAGVRRSGSASKVRRAFGGLLANP